MRDFFFVGLTHVVVITKSGKNKIAGFAGGFRIFRILRIKVLYEPFVRLTNERVRRTTCETVPTRTADSWALVCILTGGLPELGIYIMSLFGCQLPLRICTEMQ